MSNLERFIERQLGEKQAEIERLTAENDRMRAALTKIKDIAIAGHLLANRWSIVAVAKSCLASATFPGLETQMVRDGLLPLPPGTVTTEVTEDDGEVA